MGWPESRLRKDQDRQEIFGGDRRVGGGGIAGTKHKIAKVKATEIGGTYTVRECDADGNETGANITGVKNLGPDMPEIGDKVVIVKDRDADWCFQT